MPGMRLEASGNIRMPDDCQAFEKMVKHSKKRMKNAEMAAASVGKKDITLKTAAAAETAESAESYESLQISKKLK